MAPSRPTLGSGDVTTRSPNDWFSSGDVAGPNMGPASGDGVSGGAGGCGGGGEWESKREECGGICLEICANN